MQTVPSSFVRKWLPAIVFALVLHLVVIAALWHSQKQEISPTVSNNHTPTATESQVQAHAATEDLIEARSVDVVKTLTERSTDDLVEKTDSTDDASETIKANSMVEPDNSESKMAQATHSIVTEDSVITKTIENTPNNRAQTAPKKSDSTPDNNNSIPAAHLSDNENQNNRYTDPTKANPNERLLLAGDLPQAEAHGLAEEKGFKSTAQEVEALNDKLGRMVDEVKEQKLKEIDAQQQASKAAYLRAKNIQLSSTEQNPAATKDDRGDE